MAYSGRFKPTNPAKYKGDPTTIIFRSLLELKAFRWLDGHDDIITWNSEEVIIPYYDPVKGKRRRYFMDVYVKRRDVKGVIEEMLIEIKPQSQTVPPKPLKESMTRKQKRRKVKEVATWATNSAKWKAAKEFCKKNGWKFIILNEKDLGVNYGRTRNKRLKKTARSMKRVNKKKSR